MDIKETNLMYTRLYEAYADTLIDHVQEGKIPDDVLDHLEEITSLLIFVAGEAAKYDKPKYHLWMYEVLLNSIERVQELFQFKPGLQLSWQH
jgi:hypothetical protein